MPSAGTQHQALGRGVAELEAKANPLSRLTFSWLSGAVGTFASKTSQVSAEDLYVPNNCETAAALLTLFHDLRSGERHLP